MEKRRAFIKKVAIGSEGIALSNTLFSSSTLADMLKDGNLKFNAHTDR